MNLQRIHGADLLIRSAPTLAPAARATSGPLQVDNPRLDPLVSRQARFRVSGSGPLSQRSIEPVTVGAAQLVARDATAVDAVRRVLRLVEDSAGGPKASSAVRLNGVAFSESQDGLGANTYRAHLDDDATLRASVAGSSTRELQARVQRLGDRKLRENANLLANVVSGWMNLGPAASNAMLGRPGSASAQQLGDAVRIVLHESMHVADSSKSGLSAHADEGLLEALAEKRSTRLDQLQRARGVLGLDGVVDDSALASALRIRPYRQYEAVLDAVMSAAGVQPDSPQALELARRPAREAIDELAVRAAKVDGISPRTARSLIDTAFAETVQRGR